MAFPANPTKDSPFVLVLDAGTDRGYRLARALLAAGNCVVAVDRNAARLARIGHGHSSARLFLIAADTTDPKQAEQVMARAHAHFGEAPPTLALCADYRRSSAA
ncbi:MAG: SDR family NAD(P)-dependent oxidoreductase [Mycolicibacterium aromaticivorans]|nr:SDR family NAD(P)-dependent oxidoreductase [Mycolicibacterium aromaticivorans]